MEFIIVSYIFGISDFFHLLRMMKCWNPKLLIRSHLTVLITTICPLILIYLMNVSFIQIVNIRNAFSLDNVTGGKLFGNSSDQVSQTFSNLVWAFQMLNLIILVFGCLHYVFIQNLDSRLLSTSWWIKIGLGFEANAKFRKNANQITMKPMLKTRVHISKKHQVNCNLHNYKGNKMFKTKDSFIFWNQKEQFFRKLIFCVNFYCVHLCNKKFILERILDHFVDSVWIASFVSN